MTSALSPVEQPVPPPIAIEPVNSGNRRAAKNVVVSVGTQFASWALTSYVSIYLLRYLSRDDVGRFGFAGSFVLVLGVLVPFGTSQVLITQIARNEADAPRLIRTALALRIGLGFLLGLLTVFISWISRNDPATHALITIMAAGTVVGAVSDVFVSALQGQQKMARQSAAFLVERFAYSGLLLLFVAARASLPVLASATIAASLLSLGVNATAFRGMFGAIKEKTPTTAHLWRDARNLAQTGKPFLGWLLFQTLYGQTDQIVLGYIGTPADVAWYSVMFRLAGSAMFFPTAISTALLPALAARYNPDAPEAGRADFAQMARQMLSLCVFLGVPAGVLFFALPDRLLQLIHVSTVDYAGAIPALRIGGIATVLWFAAIALGTVVVASNGQAKLFRASMLGACIGIPACVGLSLWTRHMDGNGAIGAIASDAVLEIFLIVCYVRAAPPGLWNAQTVGLLLRFVVAAVPLALLVSLPVFAPFVWLAVVVGAMVYAALCVLLKAVPLSDVRKILRR